MQKANTPGAWWLRCRLLALVRPSLVERRERAHASAYAPGGWDALPASAPPAPAAPPRPRPAHRRARASLSCSRSYAQSPNLMNAMDAAFETVAISALKEDLPTIEEGCILAASYLLENKDGQVKFVGFHFWLRVDNTYDLVSAKYLVPPHLQSAYGAMFPVNHLRMLTSEAGPNTMLAYFVPGDMCSEIARRISEQVECDVFKQALDSVVCECHSANEDAPSSPVCIQCDPE